MSNTEYGMLTLWKEPRAVIEAKGKAQNYSISKRKERRAGIAGFGFGVFGVFGG